jgi:hypothetical protein
VAVVPISQEDIVVQLATWHTNLDQRRAYEEAWAEVAR